LDERLPWWSGLDNVRKRAIQNMAFQLGIGGLMGFTATLPLIRDGHYSQAAANLRQSKWAGQTPSRAKRVIRMIETGFA
jgi:lysozyme